MLPLEAVRVVDFSQRLPGPFCSSILADLGAEVIMVERADRIPETRTIFPGLFELVNRNKRSLTLNLKTEKGREIAARLIKESDVLLEEFRPGVADRLGIGYGMVKSVKPSLVYCSISGFGQFGPYRDRVGHDINYLSLSGILSIPGQIDAQPSRPGIPIVDLAAGMYAAISILAALRKSEASGEGEYIDVSMLDAMIAWMSTRAAPLLVYGKPPGNEHLSPVNEIFVTKDGKKISLGLIEENFWQRFLHCIGRSDLGEDPRFCSSSARKDHEQELLEILREIIAGKTLREWENILDWREVPYAPVYSIEEALFDPHVQARKLKQGIHAPGIGNVNSIRFPVVFNRFQTQIRRPPPAWGENTEEILTGLGYGKDEIASLKEEKVV